MSNRAAIVTGASSGIGLALARLLGETGHSLTINSRRPETIGKAAEELREAGFAVEVVPGNIADESVVEAVVSRHREAYGRLDVLVNSAGVGAGQGIAELTAKKLDLQLNANFRHIPLLYRESLDLLTAAGSEHRNALVLNVASISGKRAEAWLSIYSATKHAVVGFNQAMNRELNELGVKSCALCPAFVDTPMAEFIKDRVSADSMITTEDIAEMVRPLLSLSPGCLVPEIVLEQTAYQFGMSLEQLAP